MKNSKNMNHNRRVYILNNNIMNEYKIYDINRDKMYYKNKMKNK